MQNATYSRYAALLCVPIVLALSILLVVITLVSSTSPATVLAKIPTNTSSHPNVNEADDATGGDDLRPQFTTTPHSAEWHVCLIGCNYSSIQAAVDAASDEDVIKVASGVYTDVHGYPRQDIKTTGLVTQIVYISKTVTIQGGYTTTDWITSDPIANPTVLDAQGHGRGLYMTGIISPVIEGFRVTGGNAAGLGGSLNYFFTGDTDAGGGAYSISATAVLSNCWFFNNIAQAGGGLSLWNSPISLINSFVTTNSVPIYGGGMFVTGSAATFDHDTISGNFAASSGGGASFWSSPVTFTANTVASNASNWAGGGLSIDDHSTGLFSGNLIAENYGVNGGGLSIGVSDATFTHNFIISNTASDVGGGLSVFGNSATLDSNIISHNTGNYGGGIRMEDNSGILINNLISDNQANALGSGLYLHNSSPQLLHTTLARNHGGDGSGVYVDSGSSVSMINSIVVSHTVGIVATSGTRVTLKETLWGIGGWANGANWNGVGIIDSTGNVIGDPVFVNPPEDYHLTIRSAAINRGVVTSVTTDVDGEPRTCGKPDLGFDEYCPPYRTYMPLVSNSNAPDLTVTGLTMTSNNARVVIKNQGNVVVTHSFYVDVYINPLPAPTGVNQIWNDGRSTQGLVWYITDPVGPGQFLTLTLGGAYYVPADSFFIARLAPGTPIYAQVDSYGPTTSYGAVPELDELMAGANYNNILGPILSIATANPQGIVGAPDRLFEQFRLPAKLLKR